MTWRTGLAALLLIGLVVPSRAQSPTVVPEGTPQAGGELRDADFGVGTDQFGLDRQVEMYQWRRVGEDRYDRVWKAAWIDSSQFSAGHENPPELPLAGRHWWAPQPTLDGKPLDLAVLKALGQWQEFRPGFSRLPANLAATFQPEGDGLTSSENPLDPQVGDLRVSWRELVLPPLEGRVVLVDGAWELAQPAAPRPSEARPPVQASALDGAVERDGRYWPWIAGGLLGLGLLVFVGRAALSRRQPRRSR
ncbi:TMEM43 family protein [Lysobacter sp. F60174L2]|uniref:TMEM43 family protein n=1 Tax=Lysobacter sp. F60174L2 TaxID=3459295 RepID=UPI00403DE8D7